MMLRCPECHHRERVELTGGAWWVTCADCKARFYISVQSERMPQTMDVVCPACGYREEDVTVPNFHATVVCPACEYKWPLTSPGSGTS